MSSPRPLLLAVAGALLVLGLAACGDDEPADGYQSVGTGDTYGEWELFAEYEDGEWTGCLRFPNEDFAEQCADPDAPLNRFVSDGAVYGSVAEGESLRFADDDREVPLLEGRFYVVAESSEIHLAA